jgi:hypothetical protein
MPRNTTFRNRSAYGFATLLSILFHLHHPAGSWSGLGSPSLVEVTAVTGFQVCFHQLVWSP